MAINVYFVRHGETYFNRFCRLQGWSDTPLTEKGEQDAVAVGKALSSLHVDYLFSSDMMRAINTAKLLIQQNPNTDIKEPEQNKLFREVFYGSFEGFGNEEGAIFASTMIGKRIRRFTQIIEEYSIADLQDMLHKADPSHLASSSEQLDDRCRRMIDFLRKLPDGSTAVVVSHGSIICYLANLFAEQGQKYKGPGNGAIMKMSIDEKNAHIDFYNRTELPST